MSVEIRRIRSQDWQQSKALRLEALADNPIGFLETLAQAQELDDEVWQQRAVRAADGGEAFQVLAWDGEQPVGNSLSLLRDGRAWLLAVYVSPQARGTGLLAELVRACAAWAREQGALELVLEVHEDNARARAAYAKLGFVETGVTRPYAPDPTRRELEMALRL